MVLPRRERNSGAESLSGYTEGLAFVAMEGISMAAESSWSSWQLRCCSIYTCAALSLSIETESVRSPKSKIKYLSSLSRTGKSPVYAGCNVVAELSTRTKTCVQVRRALSK